MQWEFKHLRGKWGTPSEARQSALKEGKIIGKKVRRRRNEPTFALTKKSGSTCQGGNIRTRGILGITTREVGPSQSKSTQINEVGL